MPILWERSQIQLLSQISFPVNAHYFYDKSLKKFIFSLSFTGWLLLQQSIPIINKGNNQIVLIIRLLFICYLKTHLLVKYHSSTTLIINH